MLSRKYKSSRNDEKIENILTLITKHKYDALDKQIDEFHINDKMPKVEPNDDNPNYGTSK